MEGKQYICITKCPEVDCDNSRHCIDTKEGILEKEERCCDYYPCGNIPVWEEIQNKQYQCIKGFSVEKCDDDGFTIEGEYTTIEEGSIWNIPEDEKYRLIGGEVRLESNEFGWIEMTKETLMEFFKEI
ncbi:hypothetical protein ACYJ2U_001637 [Clostridium botulinum]